jgi:hypothetical protein
MFVSQSRHISVLATKNCRGSNEMACPLLPSHRDALLKLQSILCSYLVEWSQPKGDHSHLVVGSIRTNTLRYSVLQEASRLNQDLPKRDGNTRKTIIAQMTSGMATYTKTIRYSVISSLPLGNLSLKYLIAPYVSIKLDTIKNVRNDRMTEYGSSSFIFTSLRVHYFATCLASSDAITCAIVIARDSASSQHFLHLSPKRNIDVSHQYSGMLVLSRRSSFIATRKKRLSDGGRLTAEKIGS